MVVGFQRIGASSVDCDSYISLEGQEFEFPDPLYSPYICFQFDIILILVFSYIPLVTGKKKRKKNSTDWNHTASIFGEQLIYEAKFIQMSLLDLNQAKSDEIFWVLIIPNLRIVVWFWSTFPIYIFHHRTS